MKADITVLLLHLLHVLWMLTEMLFMLISQAVLLSERGKKAGKKVKEINISMTSSMLEKK
jgi:hypothetical protein